MRKNCAYVCCLVALLFGVHSSPFAQQLFRYKDENGNWVYSDRTPELSDSIERLDLGRASEPAEVTLLNRSGPAGIELIAKNTFYSYIQIAYRLSRTFNLPADVQGNQVLAPRSETELERLQPLSPTETISFELAYEYIPGEPGATHDDAFVYRVPYALATAYPVSQAYPSTITHSNRSSRDAIDFVMPIGTGIYAARGGVVIQTANDNFTSGQDIDTDLAQANIVRVLHDDGTMSLYGHLNWNSIRVRPGQTIERGEYIANSGNTGYSTGPHLHFVVQRNIGGELESVPVRFLSADGAAVEIHTGDLITAY